MRLGVRQQVRVNGDIGVHADHEIVGVQLRQDDIQCRVQRARFPPGDPVQLDDLGAKTGRNGGSGVIFAAVIRNDDNPVSRA